MSDVVAILNGDRGQNYPSKDKLQQSGIPFISAINIEQFVKDLINIGVLEQTSTQSRNRTFAYKEYLEILKEGT